MLDIKHGQNKKVASSKTLVDYFNSKIDLLEGKVYIGYPILYSGGENIILDALWISEEKGIIVFDLVEGVELFDRSEIRDELYNKIASELKQYKILNKGRSLRVNIEVVTFAPACHGNLGEVFVATTKEELDDIINNNIGAWEDTNEDLYRAAISVVQSVIQLKATTDRSYIQNEHSRGAIVKRLEETIANLDNQQESAIIEYYDGLQRIRGLAGSGKTIVIALKAAYLHALNPEWNIAVTFNTRSLKNQFNELIEMFCIQKIGRKPDPNKIRVIQAWGGKFSRGIYYDFCIDNNLEYFDFKQASLINGKKPAFEKACEKALTDIPKSKALQKYDAILVDEAQDLSESFLNLCYLTLKGTKKRLIYAYDELQKLNEGSSLRNPKKIFNTSSEASDIILRKCYRNPRPVLVTAHALGFGIYKNKDLVQFFDQPELWKDLGYLVKKGQLRAGEDVTLYRAEEATHKFLEQETTIEDIIDFKTFGTKEEQAKAIADDIENNLNNDELLHKDIIVINPMALTTKDEVSLVRTILFRKGIKSHIAGDSNSDEFFSPNSIAFTGINRAKGNEVPFVYIMNGHDCYSNPNPFLENRGLRERRNILFTAITRSKAWVRVFGVGERMNMLTEEFNATKRNNFELNFVYPTKEQIDKMNLITRDITENEEAQILKDTESLFGIQNMLERIKSGKAVIEDYPEDLHSTLQLLLSLNEPK